MGDLVNRHIGARIAYARKLSGLSQPQLAARMTEHGIDTTRDQIASVETGRRSARADELFAIAQILERPVGWFFEEAANLLDGDIAIPGLRVRARYLARFRPWRRGDVELAA